VSNLRSLQLPSYRPSSPKFYRYAVSAVDQMLNPPSFSKIEIADPRSRKPKETSRVSNPLPRDVSKSLDAASHEACPL
jgi:hypothetical protein